MNEALQMKLEKVNADRASLLKQKQHKEEEIGNEKDRHAADMDKQNKK